MSIKFIRDDTEEKAVKELDSILRVVTGEKRSKEVYAAKRFLLSMFRAAKVISEKKKYEREQREKEVLQKAKEEEHKLKMKKVVEEIPVRKPLPKKHEESFVENISIEDLKFPKPKAGVYNLNKLPEEGFEMFKPAKSPEDYQVLLADRNNKPMVKSKIKGFGSDSVYTVEEPEVSSSVVSAAKRLLKKQMQIDPDVMKNQNLVSEQVAEAIEKENIKYSDGYAERVEYFVRRDLSGFGRVDPLIKDKNVKIIECDGVNKGVVINLNDHRELKTNIVFTDLEELNSFAEYLASKVGSDLNNPNFSGTVNNVKVEGIIGFGHTPSKFTIMLP